MQTLEEARKKRGITVTAAHHALGVSRQTYYTYEAKPLRMPLGKFRQLCDFLEVDEADIFLPEDFKETKQTGKRKED